ncbi:hypothetical protein MNAB215_2408 [Mycobacterium numidiamassiliense]|uniref:Uncharacterized protein n=1 Tax=Mycobacterium numidiamassiliense TaxID=1841861 RepID=A0A2U3P8Y4_9MYCO|nr:hypothetical protein [Mycobacterium numidiamassiliense]SPM40212.1 hypothetical protein MNAB215_2408 [Mycobacterium numidiamassiliense]
MYLQSRSRRWLTVLRKARAVLGLSRQAIDRYVEAATQMPNVRVISERDRRVMTLEARDPLTLTFESQRLSGDSWLKQILEDVSRVLRDFTFGDGFPDSLHALDSAAEAAIPLLEGRITDPNPSIDEIIDELERALLVSLVVTMTSHNVLVEKVHEWVQQHQRFLQGHRDHDVGHYFDAKTLTYVDKADAGRIHMQDLVFAIDSGANIWMAVGGRQTLDNYPEVQAVAYAQWFAYAFALWDEQFRKRIAGYFDQRAEAKIRTSDVLIDYFGDLRLIRNDFVHNKGVCKESANAKVLRWAVRGQPMEIKAEQMMSLIDLFPRDELRTAPTPQPAGEAQKIPGKVGAHLLEDVQQRARELELTDDELAEAALSAWLADNGD